MKCYSFTSVSGECTLIIHFGLGLIGQSIFTAVKRYTVNFQALGDQNIPWESKILADSVGELIAPLDEILTRSSFQRVYIIWSAGKSGFRSGADETDEEFNIYSRTLAKLENILMAFSTPLHFILISSAGGLFEGQINVDSKSVPDPTSLYGKLKLRQEEYLMEKSKFQYKHIFRVSSVYTISNFKSRLGLIPTLMKDAIQSGISHIFGDESTLRDYILDSDIGKYIATQMKDGPIIQEKDSIEYLISGRPASIFEIKNQISQCQLRNPYLKFELERTNYADISFSPSLKPNDLVTSEISENIRMLQKNLMHSI